MRPRQTCTSHTQWRGAGLTIRSRSPSHADSHSSLLPQEIGRSRNPSNSSHKQVLLRSIQRQRSVILNNNKTIYKVGNEKKQGEKIIYNSPGEKNASKWKFHDQDLPLRMCTNTLCTCLFLKKASLFLIIQIYTFSLSIKIFKLYIGLEHRIFQQLWSRSSPRLACHCQNMKAVCPHQWLTKTGKNLSYSDLCPGPSSGQQGTIESYSGTIQCFFTPVSRSAVFLPFLFLLTAGLIEQTLRGNGVSGVSRPLLPYHCVSAELTPMLKLSWQIIISDVCEVI